MSLPSYTSTSFDFQLAFESLPGCSLLVAADESFTILGATHSLVEHAEKSRHQLVGRGLLDAFPAIAEQREKTRACIIDALRSTIETKQEQKLEGTRFNIRPTWGEAGERRWNVTITPVSDEHGHVKGAIISATETATEIHEISYIRKTLVESILGASFDGIYAVEALRNDTGTIVDFNYRFANRITAGFLGMTPEDIVGKRMLELIPENRNNGFFDLFCHALATGETVHDQTHFVSRQMKHWFNYVIVPISEETLVVTIQDISEQKRDEEVLRTQKVRLEDSMADLQVANDNLERFAFAASHDLQEPLRKVQMFSSLLLEHCGDTLDEKAQTYIRKIVSSTTRMKQLVSDILQFSQQSEAVRYDHRVDLNALLDNVELDLEIAIQQRRAHITRDKLPAVSGNPSQLNQLFFNLYSNALKFSKPTDKETKITVTCRGVNGDDLRDKSKKYVAITVADNGIGFEDKYAEKIFELFSRLHATAQYPGSGIGLALCKKIAQNHGGDIIASSRIGYGASFDVILPVA